jgi:hypothetical protein
MNAKLPGTSKKPRASLEAVLSTALELGKIPFSVKGDKLADAMMKAVGNRPVSEVLLAIKLRKIAEVLIDE